MRYRFGLFEFDTETATLRREGTLVRLQPQPARVLRLLLDHAGEIVSRDDLRTSVWGAGTFVEFDKGLNFAIGQVRTALGDPADAPRYVRTLPKRGYQFIAPVERTADGVPYGGRGTLEREAPAERRSMGAFVTRRAVLIGGAAAAASVAGLFAWRSSGPPRTIAILRFDNETGSPDYDRLSQAITDALVARMTTAADGEFGIIGNAAILRTPRDRRDLRAIGRALHAGYIVMGQVQQEGSGIRVLAHLIRLPEQTHLWVTRLDALNPATDVSSDVAARIATEFVTIGLRRVNPQP